MDFAINVISLHDTYDLGSKYILLVKCGYCHYVMLHLNVVGGGQASSYGG
jgi:hypothetical protein